MGWVDETQLLFSLSLEEAEQRPHIQFEVVEFVCSAKFILPVSKFKLPLFKIIRTNCEANFSFK